MGTGHEEAGLLPGSAPPPAAAFVLTSSDEEDVNTSSQRVSPEGESTSTQKLSAEREATAATPARIEGGDTDLPRNTVKVVWQKTGEKLATGFATAAWLNRKGRRDAIDFGDTEISGLMMMNLIHAHSGKPGQASGAVPQLQALLGMLTLDRIVAHAIDDLCIGAHRVHSAQVCLIYTRRHRSVRTGKIPAEIRCGASYMYGQQGSEDPKAAVIALMISESQTSVGAIASVALVQTLEQETKAKNKKFLKLLSFGAFLGQANNTMSMPALGQQARDLNTTPAGIALSLTFYFFAQAFMSLVIGPLADRYGRRMPMLLAHAAFILASLVCATTDSITLFIVARVFESAATCSIVIVGQGQIGDRFPREQLGKALAMFSISRMTAALFGPVVGGVICEFFGWRYCFFGTACVDTIIMVSACIYIPETLLTPLDERPHLSLLFPLRPLGAMFSSRTTGIICLLCGFNYGMMFLTGFTVPMIGKMLTQSESVLGWFTVPMMVGTVVGAMLAGKKLTKSYAGRELVLIRIGYLLNVMGCILFGWSILASCADQLLLPDGYTTPVVDGGSQGGGSLSDSTQSYHSFVWSDIDDVAYRIENELTCHDWDWFFILLLMFSQLVGGFGASLAMVGSTTFMLLCHPKARSSISSSQRLAQYIGAGTTIAFMGAVLYSLGPAWCATILCGAAAFSMLVLFSCLDQSASAS